MGAVLVANSTLPVLPGVSVLLIGNWLGLHTSKPNDKQVNANGEFFRTGHGNKNGNLEFCILFSIQKCLHSGLQPVLYRVLRAGLFALKIEHRLRVSFPIF